MGIATSGPQTRLGRHQVLVEEGIPSCEANSFGASSRIRHKYNGRSSGGRTVQRIGCTICIGPRRVAKKHCQPYRNTRLTTTAECGTAVTASERKQRSICNVCAPRPTAHNECNANATTAGARKGWTIWRDWRWTRPLPKQHGMTRSVGTATAAAKHDAAKHEVWERIDGRCAVEDAVSYSFEL